MSSSESLYLDIPFRTAAKSGGTNCIQVARCEGMIVFAHSNQAGKPVLSCTLQEFDAFIDGAKNGEFDDFFSS